MKKLLILSFLLCNISIVASDDAPDPGLGDAHGNFGSAAASSSSSASSSGGLPQPGIHRRRGFWEQFGLNCDLPEPRTVNDALIALKMLQAKAEIDTLTTHQQRDREAAAANLALSAAQTARTVAETTVINQNLGNDTFLSKMKEPQNILAILSFSLSAFHTLYKIWESRNVHAAQLRQANEQLDAEKVQIQLMEEMRENFAIVRILNVKEAQGTTLSKQEQDLKKAAELSIAIMGQMFSPKGAQSASAA